MTKHKQVRVKRNRSSAKKPTKRTIKNRRILGMRLHHASLAFLFVAGLLWGILVLVAQPILRSSAASCSISDKLVNSCRPWLGAAADNYPQAASDTKSQLLYHEQRIGRQLDIIHTYHPVGSNSLNATDIYFATRDNTYLFTNWKPAANWGDAGGGNATTNAGIDQMANSVKSLGSKKIFMTLNHEPENDVSSGASSCTTYKGTSGTPAQYRAMWSNVENRFAAAGVSNVVWVMSYMNYPLWDCMINDVYPGDNLVDWVMFDGYGSGSDTWTSTVGRFYNILTANSNGAHNYLSKPWGIVEWSYHNGTSAQHSAYFDSAKAALDNNTYPKIKALLVYDSRDKGSETGLNSRVAYDDAGNYSADQAAHYSALANDPKITGDGEVPAPPPPPPATDTVPPTVTLTAPANNATVSGNLQVSGTASDNVGVTSVTIRIDSTIIGTDTSSPYGFVVDTTKYSDGPHTITLRAWDAANNGGESATITIQVKNHTTTTTGGNTTGGSSQATPDKPATTISLDTTSTSTAPVPVAGSVIVEPTKPGSTIEVYVDGKRVQGNSIDTRKLTNGTHEVRIIEDGKSKTTYISVHNALPLALVNIARKHTISISVATVAVVGATVAWFVLKPYTMGSFSRIGRILHLGKTR